MKAPNLSKKFWVVLTTLVIMSIVFVYYFMVYMPNRENILIETKYRVLGRMGENVLARKNSYTHIAHTNTINLARSLLFLPLTIDKSKIQNLDEKARLMAVWDSIELESRKPFEHIRYSFTKDEAHVSLAAILKNEKLASDSRDIRFINEVPRNFYSDIPKKGLEALGRAYSNIFNNYNFYTVSALSSLPYQLDSIQFSMSIQKFLPTVRKADFDEFFLISAKEVTNTDAKGNLVKTQSGTILYQTFTNELRVENLDSLISARNGINSSALSVVTINDVPYKLFCDRISFDRANKEDWILCGLVQEKSFKAQVRQVEPIILLYAALILLFVLLGMPVLKLLVMSPIERLRTGNVLFNGFALVGGSALLFLIILATRHYWGYHYRQLDMRLEQLSHVVHNSFVEEANLIHTQLMTLPDLDSMKRAVHLEEEDWVKQLDSNDLSLFDYRHFNEVIWIDSMGNQILSLATHPIHSWDIPVNLSERTYFSNANEKKLWNLPDTSVDALVLDKKFALQSIQSYRDASHEVGFSIRLPENRSGARVLAMATRLQSLMDPLLPPGYCFSVIDGKGDVWFSSTIEKNLQENFIEETGSEDLKAAMYGRVARFVTIDYSGHRDRAYIRPIENTPLYLVVHYNLHYYKSSIILTANTAAMLLTFMFTLLAVQILLLFICHRRTSKIRLGRFFLSWLRPRKHPSFTLVYFRIMMVLLALLTLSFFLFRFYRHPVISFCFIVLPVYLLVYVYIVHNVVKADADRGSFVVRQQAIFGNRFVLSTVALLIVVNIMAFRFLPQAGVSLLIQGLYIFILYASLFWPRVVKVPDFWRYGSYQTHFRLFLFVWILVVGVVPAFFFYKAAYHVEQVNWMKFIQLEAARAHELYTARHEQLHTSAATRKDAIAVGNYMQATGEFAIDKDTCECSDDTHQHFYNDLMLTFKPPFDSLIRLSQTPSYGRAFDRLWHWGYGRNGPSDVVAFFHDACNVQYLSVVKPFLFYSGFYSLLFWFFIFIMLYVVYRVMSFSLRFIYGIGLLPESECISLTREFFSLEDWKTKNILLVGPPYSGKSTVLSQYREMLVMKNVRFESYDFQRKLTAARPYGQKHHVIMVEHLEFSVNDHEANIIKLELLQQFLSEPHTQVILSSAVQPTFIFDYYDGLIKESSGEKEQQYRKYLRLWKTVLGGFMIIYQPLAENPKLTKVKADTRIKEELSRGNFLPGLWQYVHSMPVASTSDYEDFILRVEELAYSYYQSIWITLSNDEKMQLYDLAKDQFVNLKNMSVIRTLVQKGIVTVEDTLQIMNRSFNNFILSVVKEDEELAMENELRRKGTWSTVQIVLVLVIVGIVVFISLAQQDILHHLNALITTLGGVIALLLRFSGLFGSAPKLKE